MSLLDTIPQLVDRRDAAALVALQDHDDKQVRKAVRKAIHALRSKGVEIPAPEAQRSWSPGAPEELRGDLSPVAMIDTESIPGLTRVMISAPQDERSYLWAAGISGRDQIVDFGAYVQTDGQRARMLREWGRVIQDRKVPLDWARGRILWAREQTLANGFSVPRQLDEMLVHLGPTPSARPSSFVAAASFTADKDNVDAVLVAARVFAWPPVLDVEPLVAKVSELTPNLTQEDPIDKRFEAIAQGARETPGLRGDLKAQVANLLDDAAIFLWTVGKDDDAGKVGALAADLRGAEAPETLPWVPRLLAYQVNSTLAYLARQQGAARSQ